MATSTETVETVRRGRGRPRTFDEEAVLDALTQLFWQQGYEATSVADIAESAGLNKSSLYNTFGSKQELFDRILDRYIAGRVEMLRQLAEEAGDGVAALHAFLEMVRAETETEMGRYGCLAVNSSAELGGESPEMAQMAHKYRSRMAETIESVIRRAADAGELDPSQVDNHTTMLVTFMLGVSVTVRGGADAEAIGRVIDAAHATVDSWAVAR
ncbi:MAG: TetR/AcrR family transcriptional regulator [Actinomycetota bacterium]